MYNEQTSSPYRYHYQNEYVERKIRTSNVSKRQDFVFKCIAQGRTRRIKEYYISQAYDLNSVERPLSLCPFASRFIFTHDETRNSLVMVTMAEEPVAGTEAVRTSGYITVNYL